MRVKISKLTFKAIIGILPQERIKKQKVIVDISFCYKYNNGKFINYDKVASLVKKTIKKQKFFLIEDAIIYLDNKLNAMFNISKLKITITKPDIFKNCKVSVAN